MTSTEVRYYKALRTIWNDPAHRALSMARDRVAAENAGITFHWEPETENPRDVFGEGCYNPDAEQWCCIARANDGDRNDGIDGAVLDSLGRIEGAWDKTDFSGYWFLIECQMSGEAIAHLDEMIESPEYESDETRG